MARTRMISPKFFLNEDLAKLSLRARLTFAGLWCLADKAGRLEDRPERIKAELFPYEKMDMDKSLEELADGGFIIRYNSVLEKMKLIQVLNFLKYQRPHHREPESVTKSMSPDISGTSPGTSRPSPGTSRPSPPKLSSNQFTVTSNQLPVTSTPLPPKGESESAKIAEEKTDPRALVDLWNELADLPPKFHRLEDPVAPERLAKARSRLVKNPDLAYWRKVILKAKTIPWLTGDGGKGNTYSMKFDWLMANEVNHSRVLEETQVRPSTAAPFTLEHRTPEKPKVIGTCKECGKDHWGGKAEKARWKQGESTCGKCFQESPEFKALRARAFPIKPLAGGGRA